MSPKTNLTDFIPKRDLNDEISKTAFGLYQQRGNLDGSDLDDWLNAEKMVMGKYDQIAQEQSADAFMGEAEKQPRKRTTRTAKKSAAETARPKRQTRKKKTL